MGFFWERILAGRNHLLEGKDEEVEMRRGDSASRETTKPQSAAVSCTEPDSAVIPSPRARNDSSHRKTH